jgi:uncharacterized protein (DUF1800 family)
MDPALRALNRFGLGARRGERQKVRDARQWLRAQLDGGIPSLAPPSGVTPTTIGDALRAIRMAGQGDEQERRQARRRVVEMTTSEVHAALTARVTSERPFVERLVAFWSNHLCVSTGSKIIVAPLAGSYERDVIRAHVLGRFEDMVLASAKHPAMLVYLDNFQSIGPNSRGAGARRGNNGQRRGLNENYARELLELHTLGVDGGYSQRDIVNVARAFTGWTMRPRQGTGFVFVPAQHDGGEKTVLGHTIKAGGGAEDGRQVLDILVAHPSTARFIAGKLAQRFVSDAPPAPLVERAARRFRETRGNLREVTRAIVTAPEFLAPDARRVKVKTPLEFVVSALRATGAEVRTARPLVRALRDLGMPLYFCQPPAGYEETADTWVSPGALVARMNFALDLAGGRLPGISLPGAKRGSGSDATAMLDESLAGELSETTRATVAKAATPDQALALVIGSPEFQRQ